MDDKDEKKYITVTDVKTALEREVPAGLQEDWDNSGLIIRFGEARVKKILTCLEIDEEVVREAVSINADMIISHHPLIFSAKKTFNDKSCADSICMELIKQGISVYSAHTSFDKVKGGNSDIVAERLGLSSVKNLNGKEVGAPEEMMSTPDEADIGRVGEVKEPVTLMQAASLVAEKLDIEPDKLRITGDPDREIKKIGICTGAGGEFIDMAASCGCQLFITGDVKYHQARGALEDDICVIDAGHYGTEKFFAADMKKRLERKFKNEVEIKESDVVTDPFTTFHLQKIKSVL